MIESVHRAGRYFGITGLDFRLTKDSRRRILQMSILPLALLGAMLIHLTLDLYYDPATPPFGTMPERWQRIMNLTAVLSSVLPPVCLAALIFGGIFRWGKAEGSWLLLTGASLIVAGLAAALAASAITAIELDPLERNHLRAYTWASWASNFGLVGAGYCFVAYRGLAARPARRTTVRRYHPLPRPRVH